MEFPTPTPALNLLVSVPHVDPGADHRELVRDLLGPHYPQAMVYVVAADVATALRQGITDAAFLRDTRIELATAERKLAEAEELRLKQARDADAKIQELRKENQELSEKVGELSDTSTTINLLQRELGALRERHQTFLARLEQCQSRNDWLVIRNTELAEENTELSKRLKEATEPQVSPEPLTAESDISWRETCTIAGVDHAAEPWKVLLDVTLQRDHHRASLRAIFDAVTRLPEFRDLNIKDLVSE